MLGSGWRSSNISIFVYECQGPCKRHEMEENLTGIYKIYDLVNNHLAESSVHYDSSKLNQRLTSLYSPGASFQYIFDFPTRSFDYVSPSVEVILGIPASVFTPQDFMDAMHPDDVQHFYNMEELTAHFLFNFLPKEAVPLYKVSYQIRLKNKKGGYTLVLHQAVGLSIDDSGNLSKVLVNHSDIEHITKVNNKKVSFLHLDNEKSYLNIASIDDLEKHQETVIPLSQRELQILQLLSEGHTSKTIANHLFLSYDTVRTHRNNILKKTAFKTIPEAISHYIREGLL